MAKNFSANSLVVIYPEQYTQQGHAISFSDPQGHNEAQHYNKAHEWVKDLFKVEDEVTDTSNEEKTE